MKNKIHFKKRINLLVIALSVFFVSKASGQTEYWTIINDYNANISFLSPPNTTRFDTLNTCLYSGKIDTTQAVQVHIFDNAQINTSEPVFYEALVQENNDTLRAIARIIVLTTNSEITSIQEIYDNDIRGMELGIAYTTLQSNVPYYTFIRYFLRDGQFISFTWTGVQGNLKKGISTKTDFFNSIQIH